jgi:hypothetical protein
MAAVLAKTLEAEPLAAYFWKQSDIPSLWNLYWTEATREDGGLDNNNPVFRQY